MVALHQEPLLKPYLGLQEGKTLIRALQAGYGAEAPAELKVLLTKLLAKSAQEHATIAHNLDNFLQARSQRQQAVLEEAIRQLEIQAAAAKSGSQKPDITPPLPPTEPPKPPKPQTGDTRPGTTEKQVYETSVQVELMLSPGALKLPPTEPASPTLPQGHRFILTNDYHPLSRRQMDQIWRFLRKPSQTGKQAKDVDLTRTVERFAKQGWLDEPAWKREKVNKVHLVILVDQSKSMVAWNSLGKQLVASALQGGGHQDAEVLWFSNLPYQFESEARPGLLYKDPTRFKSEKMEKLLRRCSKQNTEVLIFSDGGAARGGLNEARALATKQWLQILKKHASSVAWVNPMPRRRWGASTADIIQYEVAMFEPDQHGLMAAINYLRGR